MFIKLFQNDIIIIQPVVSVALNIRWKCLATINNVTKFGNL